MKLVDRHGPLVPAALGSRLQPAGVAPVIAGRPRDHTCRPWWNLSRERHRICLQDQPAIRRDELELVARTVTHAGDEELPHPGGSERPHLVKAPVPKVPVAHHPYGPSIGRPYGKGGTGHALMDRGMGSEDLPQLVVAALADQVKVDFPQCRPGPVGIVEVVGRQRTRRSVIGFEPVARRALRNRRFEDPGRMDPGHFDLCCWRLRRPAWGPNPRLLPSVGPQPHARPCCWRLRRPAWGPNPRLLPSVGPQPHARPCCWRLRRPAWGPNPTLLRSVGPQPHARP